jgi:hypothetical protein
MINISSKINYENVMNKITIILVGLLLIGCVSHDNEKQIRQAAKKLGVSDSHTYHKLVETFNVNPHLACKYLINELRVIPETHIKGYSQEQYPESMHVIWCLRALRSLTGKSFFCKTKYKFNPKEERNRIYWLYKDKKTNCSVDWLNESFKYDIPFFAVWMSRDSIFIAPPDVQKSIINQWREWYKRDGVNYDYEKSKKVNFEEFYF